MAQNWLSLLANTLSGAGQGYLQGQQVKREMEEKQKDEAYRREQLEMQRRQMAEIARMNDATLANQQWTRDQAEQGQRRDLALKRGSQYAADEVLTPTFANEYEDAGGRVNRTTNPMIQAAGPMALPDLGGGAPPAGPMPLTGRVGPVDVPTYTMPKTGQTARKGKTADELAAEQEVARALRAAIEATPEGTPARQAAILAARGLSLPGMSEDMWKTPDQVVADREREHNYRLDEIRTTAGASAANQPKWTLQPVTGPDGIQRMVRIDTKTGEVQEVTAPDGTAFGKTAPPTNDALIKVTQDALDALQAISPDAPGFSGAVGAGLQKLIPFTEGKGLPGTGAGDFLRQFDTFLSRVTLPELRYLRGLGHMSDREFKAISDAATALKPGLSEARYRELYAQTQQALAKAMARLQRGATVNPDGSQDQLGGQPQPGGAGRTGGAGPAGGAPAVGETRVVNGITYTWDGRGWIGGQ